MELDNVSVKTGILTIKVTNSVPNAIINALRAARRRIITI
jgi:hypothetical protein